jgi:hypothetical protein
MNGNSAPSRFHRLFVQKQRGHENAFGEEKSHPNVASRQSQRTAQSTSEPLTKANLQRLPKSSPIEGYKRTYDPGEEFRIGSRRSRNRPMPEFVDAVDEMYKKALGA